MNKQGLETYIKSLEENIKDFESMKGKDVDYWLAHAGGVVHERANAAMETLSVFAGKAGDLVKDTYDGLTSGVKLVQSDKFSEAGQHAIDALKTDSSMGTADRVTTTIAQSMVDFKNGNTEEATERLFELNPFYKAVESFKKANKNQASNHSALEEKNKIIDNQLDKWKEQLKDAKEQLRNIESGGETLSTSVDGNSQEMSATNNLANNTTNSTSSEVQSSNINLTGSGDFQSTLSEIFSNIERLNANIG